ncbi:MAG: zinc ribbon domain-containing protein [Candidatus Paceibacterota bacterium]|jgi:hypothetical protein
MKKCQKCFEELSDDAKFCGKCGEKMSEVVTSNFSENNHENITKTPLIKTLVAYVVGIFACILVIGLVNSIMTGIIPVMIGVILGVSVADKIIVKITGKPVKKFYFGKHKDGEEKKGVSKTLIYVIIGFVVLVIISSIILYYPSFTKEINKETGNAGNTELTYEVMQEVANGMNKEYPQMIDSDTRLDSVTGAENTLSYHYTLVNYSLADIDVSKLNDILRGDIVNLVCTTPEMKIYVKNKAVLNYTYYDKSGLFLINIPVNTGTDCK